MSVVKKKSILNSQALLGGENGGPLNQSKWDAKLVPTIIIRITEFDMNRKKGKAKERNCPPQAPEFRI